MSKLEAEELKQRAEELKRRVLRVASESTDVKIGPDQFGVPFGEIADWDDLAILELILSFEEAFEVDIGDGLAERHGLYADNGPTMNQCIAALVECGADKDPFE